MVDSGIVVSAMVDSGIVVSAMVVSAMVVSAIVVSAMVVSGAGVVGGAERNLFIFYSPFQKSLPKCILQIHWISVRFYEMGEILSFSTSSFSR